MGENNNEPREIVVSLKKLRTYVNTQHFKDTNNNAKLTDDLIRITNLMEGKYINDVRQEIIAFVNDNLNKFRDNIVTVAIVFILVNFAFRKGFKNETKVKFDSGIKSNLKTKIEDAGYDVTGNVGKLLSKATALNKTEWETILELAVNYFTASKLQRAARMLRKGVHAPKHVYKKIKSVISKTSKREQEAEEKAKQEAKACLKRLESLQERLKEALALADTVVALAGKEPSNTNDFTFKSRLNTINTLSTAYARRITLSTEQLQKEMYKLQEFLNNKNTSIIDSTTLEQLKCRILQTEQFITNVTTDLKNKQSELDAINTTTTPTTNVPHENTTPSPKGNIQVKTPTELFIAMLDNWTDLKTLQGNPNTVYDLLANMNNTFSSALKEGALHKTYTYIYNNTLGSTSEKLTDNGLKQQVIEEIGILPFNKINEKLTQLKQALKNNQQQPQPTELFITMLDKWTDLKTLQGNPNTVYDLLAKMNDTFKSALKKGALHKTYTYIYNNTLGSTSEKLTDNGLKQQVIEEIGEEAFNKINEKLTQLKQALKNNQQQPQTMNAKIKQALIDKKLQ